MECMCCLHQIRPTEVLNSNGMHAQADVTSIPRDSCTSICPVLLSLLPCSLRLLCLSLHLHATLLQLNTSGGEPAAVIMTVRWCYSTLPDNVPGIVRSQCRPPFSNIVSSHQNYSAMSAIEKTIVAAAGCCQSCLHAMALCIKPFLRQE